MAKKDFTALSVDSVDTVISTDAPNPNHPDSGSTNLPAQTLRAIGSLALMIFSLFHLGIILLSKQPPAYWL